MSCTCLLAITRKDQIPFCIFSSFLYLIISLFLISMILVSLCLFCFAATCLSPHLSLSLSLHPALSGVRRLLQYLCADFSTSSSSLLLISSSPLLLISSSPHLLISTSPHLLFSSSPYLLFSSSPLLLFSSSSSLHITRPILRSPFPHSSPFWAADPKGTMSYRTEG